MMCYTHPQVIIDFILDHTVGGDHHKAWVLDQIIRMCAGDSYERIIKDYKKEGYDLDFN